MPCWTVTKTKLELKDANIVLLKKALERLGYHPILTGTTLQWEGGEYRSGRLTIRGANGEQKGKEIRQAYSGEIIRSQAAKMGWQVKQTAPNKYQVVRGR
jgi:hypothetical protein